MLTTFTDQERQYLRNVLQSRLEDGSRLDSERQACNDIFNTLRGGNAELTFLQVAYLQQMMQEQSEIYGRISSTANEKQPVTLASFSMQTQQAIIVSIAGKLGCNTKVISNNLPPSIPNSPRGEGSRHIMVDPTLNDKFQ